jgi:hypothetical protein
MTTNESDFESDFDQLGVCISCGEEIGVNSDGFCPFCVEEDSIYAENYDETCHNPSAGEY